MKICSCQISGGMGSIIRVQGKRNLQLIWNLSGWFSKKKNWFHFHVLSRCTWHVTSHPLCLQAGGCLLKYGQEEIIPFTTNWRCHPAKHLFACLNNCGTLWQTHGFLIHEDHQALEKVHGLSKLEEKSYSPLGSISAHWTWLAACMGRWWCMELSKDGSVQRHQCQRPQKKMLLGKRET